MDNKVYKKNACGRVAVNSLEVEEVRSRKIEM